MKPDLFQAPDYYLLDDLLTEEHKLVRDSARAWVKREVSPIIEDYAQRAEFPTQIIKGLGEIGGFGPYIPEEYGGAGLDQISYGLIMQELERGDSAVRSAAWSGGCAWAESCPSTGCNFQFITQIPNESRSKLKGKILDLLLRIR